MQKEKTGFKITIRIRQERHSKGHGMGGREGDTPREVLTLRGDLERIELVGAGWRKGKSGGDGGCGRGFCRGGGGGGRANHSPRGSGGVGGLGGGRPCD